MPPKKSAAKPGKWTGTKMCGWRDVTALNSYAINGELPRGFLANILYESEYLDNYKLVPNLNECEMSFPDSDWFGVYVTDESGNGKYWFDGNGNRIPYVYYFKVTSGPDGPEIDQSSHSFKMPPELAGVRPCAINPEGKCGPPPKETPPKAPKVAKASPPPKTPKTPKAAATEGISIIPSDVITASVEALQLGPADVEETITTKVSRSDVEKMDRKEIFGWIQKHMRPEDVLACARSGALSQQDLDALSVLEGDITTGVAPEISAAVQAASSLPPKVVHQMLKQVSKESLISEINAISNESAKANAVIELCRRNNLNYETISTKRGLRIQDPDGLSISITEALDECAHAEALRLQQQLSGSSSPSIPFTESQRKRVADIIDDLLQDIKEGDFENVVAAMNNVGINVELRDNGVFRDNVEVNMEGIEDLIDETALRYIKKFNVQFGSRRKVTSFGKKKKHSRSVKIFKDAAKKCKGTSDYRKCFTKTLRKIYSKSHFGARTRPRRCKRLKKQSCRSDPQCKWSKRRKGKKVKARCVHRRKVYSGPALPAKRLRKISSFGKRKKQSKSVKIFKAAAKKCKGTANYRKCFTKTLRKMHGTSFGKRKKPSPRNKEGKIKRSTHLKRKSPIISATSVSSGTIRKGVDGNMWIVKKTKNGVKRWFKK